MFNQNTFLDKVVLVTGTASGIGKAAADAFAAQGAKVVLADIDQGGEQVAKALSAQGYIAVFQSCDVSNTESVKALFVFIPHY